MTAGRVAVFISYDPGMGEYTCINARDVVNCGIGYARMVSRATYDHWMNTITEYVRVQHEMRGIYNMAQPITCDACDGETAILLVTNLANGDTHAIGLACVPTWLALMVRSFGNDGQAGQAATDTAGYGPDWPQEPGVPCGTCGMRRSISTGPDGPMAAINVDCRECQAWAGAVAEQLASLPGDVAGQEDDDQQASDDDLGPEDDDQDDVISASETNPE